MTIINTVDMNREKTAVAMFLYYVWIGVVVSGDRIYVKDVYYKP